MKALITDEQSKYIDKICNTLNIKNPNLKYLHDARLWISIHMKQYKDAIEDIIDPGDLDYAGICPYDWDYD